MPKHILAFSIPHARELILSGKKDQTIRLAERRSDIKVGDTLNLRVWVGKPRQPGSRQKQVTAVTCREVVPYVFHLDRRNCPVYHRPYPDLALKSLSDTQKERLAERDGFRTFEELAEVLRGFYGKRALEFVAVRWDSLNGRG
jgi:hypothetical protein